MNRKFFCRRFTCWRQLVFLIRITQRPGCFYITCRWGWWMDFNFKVKNEFWSKWRRSQACKPVWAKARHGRTAISLPAGRRHSGNVFVQSLADGPGMFPQWHLAEEVALEDKWQKQGVHGRSKLNAMDPKEMPHGPGDEVEKLKSRSSIETVEPSVSQFHQRRLKIEGKMPPSILSTLFQKF